MPLEFCHAVLSNAAPAEPDVVLDRGGVGLQQLNHVVLVIVELQVGLVQHGIINDASIGIDVAGIR